MWLRYREIDFDYDEKYVDELFIKKFFDKLINVAKDVDIFEITVESTEFAMIFIAKTGSIYEWDIETMLFYKDLTNQGYDVMYGDEDYGHNLDVLIIHNYDE